jgi:aldehyde oxidoreductase
MKGFLSMPDVGQHRFFVNGIATRMPRDRSRRLSDFLRQDLQLTGTKIGCEQGDCGSCSVIVDGDAVCACLVPVGQLQDCKVTTVEGLPRHKFGSALQEAFRNHQAIQCGFCTPAFMLTAAASLDRPPSDLTAENVARELSGVLCRCTGYKKVVQAVESVRAGLLPRRAPESAVAGEAVGTAIRRLDGAGKVDGTQEFGADGIPRDALLVKVIRSPFDRSAFSIGDIDQYRQSNRGVVAVFTASDVPGRNLHGVAGPFTDQPVLAVGETRFRGEAVAMIVGERESLTTLDLDAFPVTWTPLGSLRTIEQASADDAELLHESRLANVLIRGHVERGDAVQALQDAYCIVEGEFATQFVEHAYLEPEAGWADRDGDTISVHTCTQAPHPHRSDLALILDIPVENVRVVPTAVGGGFGGKLDLTVQPFLVIAAWRLGRPVGMVYSRAESIATSTKRHPVRIASRIGASKEGLITGIDFVGDFNTGAYASWGTAVANRVPVHASGPYFVPHYRALTSAVHTHITPAGAFRGFGVPQTAVAQEQLIDALATHLKIDALEFRILNAIKPGMALVTGQILPDSVGIVRCLAALRDRWNEARVDAEIFNRSSVNVKRGVGLAAAMYGCGNTAMSNPSTIRMGVRPDGWAVLHQGAVDAGQGANTVIPQIAADALGIAVGKLAVVGADTNLTPDCGRTSASRQTFVTGKAAELAGRSLRRQILALSNAGEHATIGFGGGHIEITDGVKVRTIDLVNMPVNKFGYVLMAEETFDPLTTELGENGQGSPYAVYAFGAQIAEVEVDLELGTVQIRRFTAAHDVGQIVNPTLLEGQIEGAVAQGIGLALMEKFIPGETENLHDYLIATVRDMPEIETIFIEENAAAGPYGAKGIGEPSLVPTAASILNAIYQAIGARITTIPATPESVLHALKGRNGRSNFIVERPS